MFFLSCNTLIKTSLPWASVLRMDVQVGAVQLRVRTVEGEMTLFWFLKFILPSTLSS